MFILAFIADYLAVYWVTGIERRNAIIVGVIAGINESIFIGVGWLTFVGESIPAAIGMITGAITGAIVAVIKSSPKTR